MQSQFADYYTRYLGQSKSGLSGMGDRPLKLTDPMMRGEDVISLQAKLQSLGYALPRYGVDGIYGRETQGAVKQFQQQNGLSATGVVDAETWAALKEGATRNAQSATGNTSSGNTKPNWLYWAGGGLAAVGLGIAAAKNSKKTK